MTTKQKAKTWDLLKEATHDQANSTAIFMKREVKETARALFTLMCEAEVSVMKHHPELGKEES